MEGQHEHVPIHTEHVRVLLHLMARRSDWTGVRIERSGLAPTEPSRNHATARLVALLLVVVVSGCTVNGSTADDSQAELTSGPSVDTTSMSSTETTEAMTSTTGALREATAAEMHAAENDPIYGYADFSAYSYATVPWDEVVVAMIACMRDRGWAAEPSGPTAIDWSQNPKEQGLALHLDQIRCDAGLNLPEVGVPSALDIEGVYVFWVDVLVPCYEEQGHVIPDPPSLVTFVESYPQVDWAPWRFVDGSRPGLEEECSSNPYDHELPAG